MTTDTGEHLSTPVLQHALELTRYLEALHNKPPICGRVGRHDLRAGWAEACFLEPKHGGDCEHEKVRLGR